MFKKITAILISTIIIATCFSACGDKEAQGETFACAVTEMPEHFDPQIASTTGEKMIAVNLYDGLFKPDENGELLKCAAEDYSISEDGLTYSFRLRKDLKYFASESVKDFVGEKGGKVPEQVTADDFVFGITRAVLPETDAPLYNLLSVIKNADKVHNGVLPPSELGIRAVDKFTLEIKLERKSSDFLFALSQPVSFPCNREFFELTGGRYGLEKKYTLTNGAFYLATVTEDKSVRISKNEEYSGAFASMPSAVTFYLNENPIDAAKKVDNGDYDCGFFNSAAADSELGRRVQKKELQNVSVSLVFNMKKEAMQNADLRTGLISSIDTSAYSKNPINGLLSPYYKAGGKTVDASAEKISFDVNASRERMKTAFNEMKIKNLTVELLCTKENSDTAKKIVSNWQKNIGVELNGIVTAVNDDEFDKKLRSGEYDIALCPLSVDSDNAVSFLSMFKSGENSFGYSSEEYDRMFGELRLSPSVQKANACQSHLLKNAVVLPLYYDSTVFATAKNVSGIYFCGDSANVYFYKGQK